MALSRWRTAAAIAFIAAFALAFAASAQGARVDATRAAAVTSVDGDVFVHHVDGATNAASVGDVVAAGDAIRTARGASIELTYVEGSSMRTGESTAFVVEGLATEPGRDAVQRLGWTAGRAWQAITKMLSGGSRYETRLPASTASVRG